MSADASARRADRDDDRAGLWIEPSYRELFAVSGLASLEDLFCLRSTVRFEKASLGSWRERLAVDLEHPGGRIERLYVKRYHRPPANVQRSRILSGHGRRSTAGVERFWIEAVGRQGVAVPRVVAFGEQRERLTEVRSALVLAEVPGVSLEHWVGTRPGRAPAKLVKMLARFVASFHEAGFIHRDLYLSHIFVDGMPAAETQPRARDAGAPAFVLIDLQRVLKRPLRRRRWLARDLAQLNFSAPRSVAGLRERLLFIKTYLGVRSLRGPEERGLLRRVAVKTERIAARQLRRGDLDATVRSFEA